MNLNDLMAAFEIRLCLGSPQAARVEGQDGLAMPQVPRPDLGIRMGRCNGHFPSSWGLQSGQDTQVDGAWEAIGGLSEEETGDELGLSYESLEMLGSIVAPERSYVWAFTGDQVPGSRNTMVKSPLSARVIFNVDDGDVNVLDITKNKHPIDYHLGERDFVEELEDIRHDPIEVTFDKGTKRLLNQSLEKMTGSLTVDTFMEAGAEERRNRKAPNLMALEELREKSAQVRKTGKRALWEHDQGYLTMLCLDPRRIPIREVGPGNRPWRWTAVLDGDKWRWCEKRCQGETDGQVAQADAALVFYDWIPDTSNYAEGFDLSAQEKRALLRSHINLGHPGRAEFVRILKGAGCRSDIIQYVQREFKCAGCDLEQRPPTRLPAATPRTYDFNVVIGVDVLFIHGVDNRTEHPILNITCLGALYSTFGVIDPLRRSSKLTLNTFERLWLRTFGPPDYILYDQGTEFTGGDFQSGLEKFSIMPLVTSQDAPWENGVCERRGDLCKKIFYKSREVVQPRDLDEVELLGVRVSLGPSDHLRPIRVYSGATCPGTTTLTGAGPCWGRQALRALHDPAQSMEASL